MYSLCLSHEKDQKNYKINYEQFNIVYLSEIQGSEKENTNYAQLRYLGKEINSPISQLHRILESLRNVILKENLRASSQYLGT